jgi:hypothetical protein
MPGISPAIPGEISVPNEKYNEFHKVCIELLEFFSKGFRQDITYRRVDSIETTVKMNWQAQIDKLYKHSDGWNNDLPDNNYRNISFSIGLYSGSEITEEFGEYISMENNALFCDAQDATMFNIEPGIRHLEALEDGLREAALLLLDETPVHVHTPNDLYDYIINWEWSGEEDESARYEEMMACGYDRDEIEVITRAELLEYYPEWILEPKKKKGIWKSKWIPEPMRELKKASVRFKGFGLHDYNWYINKVPCASAYFGGDKGADIMLQAVDGYINDLQQMETVYFSPIIFELLPDNPEQVIDQLKAYFDCLYWTGEFLKYLQGSK